MCSISCSPVMSDTAPPYSWIADTINISGIEGANNVLQRPRLMSTC